MHKHIHCNVFLFKDHLKWPAIELEEMCMQQIIMVEYGKYYAKTMTENTPGKQKRSLNPSL